MVGDRNISRRVLREIGNDYAGQFFRLNVIVVGRQSIEDFWDVMGEENIFHYGQVNVISSPDSCLVLNPISEQELCTE